MDPDITGDMFPQVVGAHVHQFNGIQGGTTVVGIAADVGGSSLKVEFRQIEGSGTPHSRRVVGVGVEGHGQVQVTERTAPGHKGLAGQGSSPGQP